jgi:hypothetical protein
VKVEHPHFVASTGPSQKNLVGGLAAHPPSGSLSFCGSRHPIDLDAMVANLTLEEGELGTPAIADPIRSSREMSWKIV